MRCSVAACQCEFSILYIHNVHELYCVSCGGHLGKNLIRCHMEEEACHLQLKHNSVVLRHSVNAVIQTLIILYIIFCVAQRKNRFFHKTPCSVIKQAFNFLFKVVHCVVY